MSSSLSDNRSDHSKSTLSRFIRRCDEFRGTPTAVLTVSTMAIFADTVVYGLIVPFLPDILQDKLGMSSSANGILFGCFGAGVLVGAPTSAYISDRWNIRKWPMIIGLLGLGLTSVLFAFANAFWELVLARLAQGISSGITWSIGLGMVADVYEGDSIGKAMGIVFSGNTVGYLGGPFLGGVIYNAGGIHAISIFVGVITVVDLVFRLLLKEPDTRRKHHQHHQDEENSSDTIYHSQIENVNQGSEKDIINISSNSAKSSVGCVAYSTDYVTAIDDADIKPSSIEGRMSRSPSLSELTNSSHPQNRTTAWDLIKEWPIIACCIATVTVTGVLGSFEPTLPVHLRDEYNTKEIIISLVFIAIVVPTAIVGPIAGKISDSEAIVSKLAPYGRFGFLIIGSIASAIIIACLGATRSLATLIVCLSFLGITIGFAEVPIIGAMAVHVSRMGGDAYAMVYALYNIAYSIGVIIVPTIIPPIMNAIGFAATMGVVASILVLGALIASIQPTVMLWRYGRKAFVGENARVFL